MIRAGQAAWAASAAALAVVFFASDASAFCRTWTCDPRLPAGCPQDPEAPGCLGGDVSKHKRIFWPQRCIGFSVQQDTTAKITAVTAPDLRLKLVENIMNTAFTQWQKAGCGGTTTPSIELFNMGAVACDKQEYNKDQGNANIVMFRKGTWPYPGASTVLALTTVTFNVQSGEIYDADIEINDTMTFSVTDTAITNDLQAALTHEAGHFLGLSHSTVAGSTMTAEYKAGETYQRDLANDDIAGVCSVYPPERVNLPECNPEPRHGFAAECAVNKDAQPDGSATCSVREVGSQAGGGAASLLALAGAAFLRGARSRRKTA